MKDRIDPLISERAPWLDRPGSATTLLRALLHNVLSYRDTLALGAQVEHLTARDIMQTVAARIARNVSARGLGNIPAHGPAMIVANHPTGIADGIVLYALIAQTRPDAYLFANADILRILPQMDDIIAPVEWRPALRTHGKNRATMAFVKHATDAGRLGVIFPSGRLAKRKGLRLHERPWMTSAAMLAKRRDLAVIPVHIAARNSVLFYLFDAIHPTLRDITLFHEVLNKARQPFEVRVGDPIAPRALPADLDEATQILRNATLALGEDAPAVSLVRASRSLLKP